MTLGASYSHIPPPPPSDKSYDILVWGDPAYEDLSIPSISLHLSIFT